MIIRGRRVYKTVKGGVPYSLFRLYVYGIILIIYKMRKCLLEFYLPLLYLQCYYYEVLG